MSKNKDVVDPVDLQIIEHLLIRDKNTGKTLVNKRDSKNINKQISKTDSE